MGARPLAGSAPAPAASVTVTKCAEPPPGAGRQDVLVAAGDCLLETPGQHLGDHQTVTSRWAIEVAFADAQHVTGVGA